MPSVGKTVAVASLASAGTMAATVAGLLAPVPARAGPVLVNGNFEAMTVPASTEFGDRFRGQVVTGWTTGGYNFLFKPGTADATGAANEYGQQLKLWGPGNGAANGLPSASPAGGNFIGADGIYFSAPIQQTITGLVPGGDCQRHLRLSRRAAAWLRRSHVRGLGGVARGRRMRRRCCRMPTTASPAGSRRRSPPP